MFVGAIEAGGTKFVCAVGTGQEKDLLARIELPTSEDRSQVLARAAAWFEEQQKKVQETRRFGDCFVWTDRSERSVADVRFHHVDAETRLA